MAYSLNIGGGSISLVQNGAGLRAISTAPSASLSAPSTYGTTLIACLANPTGIAITTASVDPTLTVGWRLLATRDQGVGNAHLEVWVYENNIGGITTATFASVNAAWTTHISEWANAKFSTTYQGTAVSSSGTTLGLVLGVAVPETNDLAIAVWFQMIAANTAIVTTPGSWTRLLDDGAASLTDHIDIEYQLNPALTTQAVTLTSNRTTTSAAGIELALTHPAAAVDQITFVEYGSMSMKQNTLDFALIDPATTPALGDNVTLTDSAAFSWSGKVVSVRPSDIVDRATGHKRVTISAINQTVNAPVLSAFNLSDAPSGSNYGYRNLGVQSILNTDGTYSTYGTVEVETGIVGVITPLAQGQTVAITSANLGYVATTFTVTNATVTWQGSASANPTFFIEFGTALQTGKLHLLR